MKYEFVLALLLFLSVSPVLSNTHTATRYSAEEEPQIMVRVPEGTSEADSQRYQQLLVSNLTRLFEHDLGLEHSWIDPKTNGIRQHVSMHFFPVDDVKASVARFAGPEAVKGWQGDSFTVSAIAVNQETGKVRKAKHVVFVDKKIFANEAKFLVALNHEMYHAKFKNDGLFYETREEEEIAAYKQSIASLEKIISDFKTGTVAEQKLAESISRLIPKEQEDLKSWQAKLQ